MRLLVIFISICVIVAVPFLFWGGSFEEVLGGKGAKDWLLSFDHLAWAVAILLLISDLLLPIPATAVMGALGMIYGPFVGGVIGAAGSVASGLVAYLLCRRFGRGLALKISGEKEMKRAEGFFDKYGGWAIAVSRWMPIFPEALACLAGITKMNFTKFMLALTCGSLTMAVAFASLGSIFAETPLYVLTFCALFPVVLLIVTVGILKLLSKPLRAVARAFSSRRKATDEQPH